METSLIGKALDFGSNDCGFESRVSNIFYNYSYNYVINHLIFNIQKKNLKCELLHTKKILKLLSFFKKIGLIKNYFCFFKKMTYKIKVSLGYYKLVPIFKKIKLLSTPSRFFFISFNAAKLMHSRSLATFCVLSTPKGLLTLSEAVRLKTGGKLLMTITL